MPASGFCTSPNDTLPPIEQRRRPVAVALLGAALVLTSGLLPVGTEGGRAFAAPRHPAKARSTAAKPVLIEGVRWHPDVRRALTLSSPARKPVVWMRVLGDLAGDTWSAGHAMRAGSLAASPVSTRLRRDWICAFTNTEGDPNAGGSFAHSPKAPCSPLLRGNGEHNVQLLFLTPDGRLLHVLAGYVPSSTLAEALDFAHALNDLVSHAKTDNAQRFLVRDAHARRLRAMGEDATRPYRPNDPREMLRALTDDVPAGVAHTSDGTRPFQRMQRMRDITDLRYAHAHPLQRADDFRPEALVGSGMSWFGAHSGSSTPGTIGGLPLSGPPSFGPRGGRDQPGARPTTPDELPEGIRQRLREMGVPMPEPQDGPAPHVTD